MGIRGTLTRALLHTPSTRMNTQRYINPFCLYKGLVGNLTVFMHLVHIFPRFGADFPVSRGRAQHPLQGLRRPFTNSSAEIG